MVDPKLLEDIKSLTAEDRAELLVKLLEDVGDDLAPLFEVTGLSHRNSVVPNPLPHVLKTFPVYQTGWILISMDEDAI